MSTPRAQRPARGPRRSPHAGVVGAGIQGIGIALELAERGFLVDVHEKTERVHGRASLANEGKIHVGYIYANDPSLRTARQMVEGAWSFSPILGRWLASELPDAAISSPFRYLVHRHSLVDPATLSERYARIAQLNGEMAARPGTAYFGRDGARPPRLLPDGEREAIFGPDIIAAFGTPEIAVDTEAIGALLDRRLRSDPRIRLRLGSEVMSASADAGGASLQARMDGQTETIRYDHVINASWEDLLHIDATAGLDAPPGSSFRWRHILRVPAPHGGPGVGSCSVVLGPYGDLVEYGGGDLFLSWYPVGRRGLVTTMRPPAAWADGAGREDAAAVRSGTFVAMRGLIEGLKALDPGSVMTSKVHAGIVYARGTTDINDPASGFHERHAIGPRSMGRYHSVDTGKYTTAPLFARRLADRIAGGSLKA